MTIAYKDFQPAAVETTFFKGTTYEPMDAALARANQWMNAEGVRVINIETVVLPNLGANVQSSTSGIRTRGEVAVQWHQVIRVWYEVGEPPPPEAD